MIDIHCHVLPAIDDGARDLETSVAMCRMAVENGTTGIVCSAHSNNEYAFDPAVVQQKIDQVMEQTGGAPMLYPGCDFHLSYENIQAAIGDPHRYTINHKQYLLVEFADFAIPSMIGQVFNDMRNRGIVPIVTHPERNPLILRQRDVLYDWIDMGALVQVTANSVTGAFGRSAQGLCEWLLEREMVHFIASDAHNMKSRTTNLKPAYETISRMLGEKVATLLMEELPRAAVEGHDIYMPVARRRTGFWSRLTSGLRRS